MPQLLCGIVGLPNAGKSTLFNALTHAHADVASYPFCTIEPNVGVIPVKDPRLDRVAELVGVSDIIYHTIEYVDVAGLVEGASRGEGRGNQFLEHIRTSHALVHVVRCFDDPDVAHVTGDLDPIRDIRTVELELILADIETLERAIEKHAKAARRDPEAKALVALLETATGHLSDERPIRSMDLSPHDRHLLREFRLLTAKPVLYAANIGEGDLPGDEAERTRTVREWASREGNRVVPICAKLEEEIARLEPDEADLFLTDSGLVEPALQRLARETTTLLGFVSFLTFNNDQARAWKIPEGTRAQDAAGEIHTDFSQHFVRAEVTSFLDFDRVGGPKAAHEHGVMRTEGRDYIVQDGDVILFRIGL